MNADTYLANARDENGNLRPLSQLLEAEKRAQKGAQIATALARQEAEAQKSGTQKLLDSAKTMLAQAKFKSSDRDQIKYWQTQVKELEEKHASEQATEARAKAFAADRRIELIREEADAIARSGQALLPNSSPTDRATLVAIARSNDYPTPESQYREFRELADRLTNAELEAERVKASDAAIESARQNVALAESKVRQIELETMRANREAVE